MRRSADRIIAAVSTDPPAIERPSGATPSALRISVFVICLAFSSRAIAHPDHNLGEEPTPPPPVESVGVATEKPTQADRQQAFFAYQLLTEVVDRCPTPSQQKYIEEAVEEHKVATNAWGADPVGERVASRHETLESLTNELDTIDLVWDSTGPQLTGERDPIELATSLGRLVLLRVTNQTGDAIDFVAESVGGVASHSSYTVLPGKVQYVPVELLTDDTSATSLSIRFRRTDVPQEAVVVEVPVVVRRHAVLRGELVDSDRGEPWPGRLYVRGSDHQYRRGERFAKNETLSRKQLLQFWDAGKFYQLPFFYSDGTFEVRVPPGEVRLTLERGFEHELVSKQLRLEPGEERNVRLSSGRFVDMRRKGWISGDTHVHWVLNRWDVDLPLELLATVQRAEDLRVANNLTLLQRGPNKAFINPHQAPMGSVEAFCDSEYHIEMGEEYRNENLYGHLCFLNLDWLVQPIGTGEIIAGPDALDYPINKTAILACQEQGGISIEAHGLGGNKDVPANVVHGLTDSLDQIRPDEYYRFLECGFKLPLTNGSDHPARPLGSARAYVHVDGEFTYAKWIEGIRQARTFTTSGPLISLSVNGAGIGDTLDVPADRTLTITARVDARRPVEVLQIVSNGEVLLSQPINARTGTAELRLPAGEARWIVAQCGPAGSDFNAIWEPRVAHTSAVYVNVDGQSRFDESDANIWVDRLRQHARDIKAKGRFANDAQRDEAVGYIEDGIQRFNALIQEHAQVQRTAPRYHLTGYEAPPKRSTSWPVAVPVDSQPLLLQIDWLAEALNYIGNPLSEETRAALKSLEGDNETVTREVEALLDPLCLAGVLIRDGRIQASPGVVERALVEQGWRSFLVKVCNEAELTTRLHVESPNARPRPHSKATEVKSRWMGLTMFDGRPMQASLSGLPLEYRIVQVYSHDAGQHDATLEFSVDATPGTKGRLIREWRFDKNTDGWVAANQVDVEARDGSLHIDALGEDPFITSEVEGASGELLLRFWGEAEKDGVGQVFFWTEGKPVPDPNKVVTFALMPGSAQQYEASFHVDGVLAGVRIDPNVKASKMRIDWADLSFAHRRGETWTSIPMSFEAEPAIPVTVEVIDKHPESATAAFVIRDKLGRVYPEQSKRLAPDLFFHSQVYRMTGETIRLPPGEYEVEAWRGPESLRERSTLRVGDEPTTLTHRVRRWIDPSDYGWWSGDHHIHAAGCLHYQNPTQGILPEHMMRQIMGEDLHVGCCLTWGPCFDYQKQFFTGDNNDGMNYPYLVRYDVEVSGFGSHASGHLSLLRLKDQIYPGGNSKDHWPTLGLNTLLWAKKQGAVCGTAHSGAGLTRYIDRLDYEAGANGLPHYNIPAFDGIGANEFIVDVTHEVEGPDGKPVPAIDFIATMNTERVDEWNIWYHTLNCGYRVRASGETDFPCMSGERVGIGRVYVQLDNRLNYPEWVQGIKEGRSYVSDAKVHLMDFVASPAEGQSLRLGENASDLRLSEPRQIEFSVQTAGLLKQEDFEAEDADSVEIELIVNGQAAAKQQIPADGSVRELTFDASINRSSWVAVRCFPHAHTNPIFVVVDDQPIRASKASAEWCLRSVEQCWSNKRPTYARLELPEAEKAYRHARRAYQRILSESPE